MSRLARKQMNFLPKELQPSFANLKNFYLFLAVTGLLIPGIGAGLKFAQYQTSAKVQELEAQRNEAQNKLTAQIKSRDENSDIKTVRSVKNAMAQKIFWASIFKELSSLSPQGIWLTDLETKLEENHRTILISGEARSQEEVARFLDNLEKSFHFRDLKLAYTELAKANRRDFVRFQFQGKIFDKNGEEHHAKN